MSIKQIPFFDLNRQVDMMQDRLDAAWSRVRKSGRFISGEEVPAFESEFADWLGAKHVVGCSSGTDALELILRSWGIGQGDEVIVPANTWVSDAEVVVRVGARPVFADVNLSTGLIEPDHVLPLVSSKTKALIAVHMYGTFCTLEGFLELGREHDFKIIEDCAHATGLKMADGCAGTLADAAAFSFYPTKNLGALGDAGCVVTKDEEFANEVSLLRDHGQPERDKHLRIGSTCRMDEVQAAILREKLTYLESLNKMRRENARELRKAVKSHSKVNLGFEWQEEGVAHLFVVNTPDREALMQHLDEHHIGYSIHYPQAIPLTAAFQPYSLNPGTACVNAVQRSNQILSLPVYPELRPSEIDRISEAIRRF